MRDLNSFKGCLVGGAVGDALGYPVEFMSASSIFHPQEYILRAGEYLPVRLGVGHRCESAGVSKGWGHHLGSVQ